MDLNAFFIKISGYTIPILFAIALHEVAHGWMARCFGDRTAEMLGRLSLNPLRHIDPVGTLLVPAILLVAGVPVFGWAKSVPVATSVLRHPRRAMVCVALAGPGANLAMAAFWCGVLGIALRVRGSILVDHWVAYMAQAGILINVLLALINLLPILPLDGGRIVAALLPQRLGVRFAKIEPIGLWIVIALIVVGLVGWMFKPALYMVGHIISALFGARS